MKWKIVIFFQIENRISQSTRPTRKVLTHFSKSPPFCFQSSRLGIAMSAIVRARITKTNTHFAWRSYRGEGGHWVSGTYERYQESENYGECSINSQCLDSDPSSPRQALAFISSKYINNYIIFSFDRVAKVDSEFESLCLLFLKILREWLDFRLWTPIPHLPDELLLSFLPNTSIIT